MRNVSPPLLFLHLLAMNKVLDYCFINFHRIFTSIFKYAISEGGLRQL